MPIRPRAIVVLDVAEYELLQRVASLETRTADQQAAHFVRRGLRACEPVDVTGLAPTDEGNTPGLVQTPAEDAPAPASTAA